VKLKSKNNRGVRRGVKEPAKGSPATVPLSPLFRKVKNG